MLQPKGFIMLRFRWLLLCLVGLTGGLQAQELFVFNEPASNMPAHSSGLRLTNWVMKDDARNGINYHLIPELMYGVNNKLMIHGEAFLSNRSNGLAYEGVGIYAKYRVYSRDNMYRHFRVAIMGRLSTNNAPIHQDEIATNGHNTGSQYGIVTTQLLHKTAISATIYSEDIMNNGPQNEVPQGHALQAMNYRFSIGRLMHPKSYTKYGQTNINVMVELLCQRLSNGKSYIDLAPSVQMIINSQTRLDIGYLKQLQSNMERTAPQGLLVRLEHLVFKLKA